MAESKMPARIWTDEECATKWLVTPTKGDSAYIRADLVEQMAAALRLATAQLAHYEPVAPFITAALQAYEAAQ